MTYANPESLSEALSYLHQCDARVLAGGTDFYPSLQDGPAPVNILDVSRIGEMRGVARTADGWRLGATATWSEIAKADLPPVFAGLQAAAREVGSVQIQNSGTVAGNICNASPAADGVPPLLTLEASVEIAGTSGIRTVALSDFITGVRETALNPGELVVAVRVPDYPDTAFSSFRKLGSRRYLVISIAMIAITIVPDAQNNIGSARIAVGACSPVARRMPALEKELACKPLGAPGLGDLIRAEHLDVLTPIGDVRGTASYRLDAVAELLRRMLDEISGMERAA